MENSEKQKLKALVVATGLCYGRNLSDDVVLMYVEDLEDLPFEKVMVAFREVRKDPKTKGMPLIGEIRAKCCPEDNNRSSATIAVSRLIEAISKFGWPNHVEAREYIGDLGWAIVERNGGWGEVCKLEGDQLGIFRAQAINLAENMCERAKAGLIDDRPVLPTPQGMTSIKNLLSDGNNEMVDHKVQHY